MLWLRNLKTTFQELRQVFTILLSRAASRNSTTLRSRIPRRMWDVWEYRACYSASWFCCLDTLIKDATFSFCKVPTVFSFCGLQFCSKRSYSSSLRASKLLTLKNSSSPRAHSPCILIPRLYLHPSPCESFLPKFAFSFFTASLFNIITSKQLLVFCRKKEGPLLTLGL